MLLEPELELIPEGDGEFSIIVRVTVPLGRYEVMGARPGGPDGVSLEDREIDVAWRVQLRVLDSLSPGETEVIRHRIGNLRLVDGQVLGVFLMLADVPVGRAELLVEDTPVAHFSVTVAAVRQVPIEECMEAVVSATPQPELFTGPGQLLNDLGVRDTMQTRLHQDGVARDIQARNGKIDPNLVKSGPSVTVAVSTASVFASQEGKS